MNMVELAKRFEQATGADRALDVAACEAAAYEVLYDRGEPYYEPIKEYSWQSVPAYTSSLDAAMTLVPNGLLWTMDSWSASQWSAGIWRHREWLFAPDENRQSRSPALALCASALRARAAISDQHRPAEDGK